jgi:hypothetical protein
MEESHRIVGKPGSAAARSQEYAESAWKYAGEKRHTTQTLYTGLRGAYLVVAMFVAKYWGVHMVL